MKSVTQPSHGNVVINADGTVSYTPEKDYNGQDSFTYTIVDEHGKTDTATVNLTINPENDNPVAINDSARTNENQSVNINVLRNDYDVDGDTVSVHSITNQPDHGTIKVNSDGTITYTPNKGYDGYDYFEYKITDGNGGYDTARVDIKVDPIIINARVDGTSAMYEGNDGWYNVKLDKPVTEDTWVTVQVYDGSANRVDADGWEQNNQNVNYGGYYDAGFIFIKKIL